VWSVLDGMRIAVPHLPFTPAGALSTVAAQRAARAARPPVPPSPALLDVRAAAARLAAAGVTVFGREQVVAQLRCDGAPWTDSTVRDLLQQEVTWRPDAELVRVGRGRFALASTAPARADVLRTAHEHVLDVVVERAAAGAETVRSVEVHQVLTSRGIRYRRDTVSAALSDLARREPPRLQTRGRGRYLPAPHPGTDPDGTRITVDGMTNPDATARPA
jgi:hypothetical protein